MEQWPRLRRALFSFRGTGSGIVSSGELRRLLRDRQNQGRKQVTDEKLDYLLTPEILELPDGYSRLKNAPRYRFRYMTPDEARKLTPGVTIPFQANDGTARRVRMTGKIRTWKRDPNRLEIPFKYGFHGPSMLFVARENYMVEWGGCAYLLVRL